MKLGDRWSESTRQEGWLKKYSCSSKRRKRRRKQRGNRIKIPPINLK
jgi:hypothetical protein